MFLFLEILFKNKGITFIIVPLESLTDCRLYTIRKKTYFFSHLSKVFYFFYRYLTRLNPRFKQFKNKNSEIFRLRDVEMELRLGVSQFDSESVNLFPKLKILIQTV